MMPGPKTRKKPQIPQILSPQQQTHLLDALYQAGNHRDAMLISLVLKTGLKSAEVCALDVADVRQGQKRKDWGMMSGQSSAPRMA